MGKIPRGREGCSEPPGYPRPKRPTCLTCPHFKIEEETYGREVSGETYDDLTDGFDFVDGECLFAPPIMRVTKSAGMDWENAMNWTNPKVYECHSCGQHPDFPAFAQALKEWWERPDFVEIETSYALGKDIDLPSDP